MSKKSEVKGRIIINPEMTFNDNDLCFMFFGMSMDMLAEEIRNNKDGKYDDLYVFDEKEK